MYACNMVSSFATDMIIDWPYCNAARRLTSVQMIKTDWSAWDHLQWRRRLETFGSDDSPIIAAGIDGEVDGVWYDAQDPDDIFS